MIPAGEDYVLSETLGAVRRLTGGETRATGTGKEFGAVSRMLAACAINCWHKESNAEFTSITLNKNYAERLHRDSNNQVYP